MIDPDEIVRRILNTSFLEQENLQGTPVFAAWIAVQLTKLAMALGEDVSTERIVLTAETLMELEPLYLDWALERARRECATFPRPVEIVEFLREVPGCEAEQ